MVPLLRVDCCLGVWMGRSDGSDSRRSVRFGTLCPCSRMKRIVGKGAGALNRVATNARKRFLNVRRARWNGVARTVMFASGAPGIRGRRTFAGTFRVDFSGGFGRIQPFSEYCLTPLGWGQCVLALGASGGPRVAAGGSDGSVAARRGSRQTSSDSTIRPAVGRSSRALPRRCQGEDGWIARPRFLTDALCPETTC